MEMTQKSSFPPKEEQAGAKGELQAFIPETGIPRTAVTAVTAVPTGTFSPESRLPANLLDNGIVSDRQSIEMPVDYESDAYDPYGDEEDGHDEEDKHQNHQANIQDTPSKEMNPEEDGVATPMNHFHQEVDEGVNMTGHSEQLELSSPSRRRIGSTPLREYVDPDSNFASHVVFETDPLAEENKYMTLGKIFSQKEVFVKERDGDKRIKTDGKLSKKRYGKNVPGHLPESEREQREHLDGDVARKWDRVTAIQKLRAWRTRLRNAPGRPENSMKPHHITLMMTAPIGVTGEADRWAAMVSNLDKELTRYLPGSHIVLQVDLPNCRYVVEGYFASYIKAIRALEVAYPEQVFVEVPDLSILDADTSAYPNGRHRENVKLCQKFIIDHLPSNHPRATEPRMQSQETKDGSDDAHGITVSGKTEEQLCEEYMFKSVIQLNEMLKARGLVCNMSKAQYAAILVEDDMEAERDVSVTQSRKKDKQPSSEPKLPVPEGTKDERLDAYKTYNEASLKEECKRRGLKCTIRKTDRAMRLARDDLEKLANTPPAATVTESTPTVNESPATQQQNNTGKQLWDKTAPGYDRIRALRRLDMSKVLELMKEHKLPYDEIRTKEERIRAIAAHEVDEFWPKYRQASAAANPPEVVPDTSRPVADQIFTNPEESRWREPDVDYFGGVEWDLTVPDSGVDNSSNHVPRVPRQQQAYASWKPPSHGDSTWTHQPVHSGALQNSHGYDIATNGAVLYPAVHGDNQPLVAHGSPTATPSTYQTQNGLGFGTQIPFTRAQSPPIMPAAQKPSMGLGMKRLLHEGHHPYGTRQSGIGLTDSSRSMKPPVAPQPKPILGRRGRDEDREAEDRPPKKARRISGADVSQTNVRAHSNAEKE